jgi:hypothetical protein
MIDADSLDRIRAVLASLPGVEGFALALTIGGNIEVMLQGTLAPEASAQAIRDVAAQVAKALSEEPPLRVN